MSKESLNSPYANLVFRETFNDEQSVRKNGGIPTDVDFSEGSAHIGESSSFVNYNKSYNGTYSLRFIAKKTDDFSISRYLIDYRATNGDGDGYVLINRFGVVSVTSGTVYVNGELSTTYTLNIDQEIIITGITLKRGSGAFLNFIGSRFNKANSWNGDIDLVEIYKGTLTASEVANLYNNTWNKELTGMGGQATSGNLVKNGTFDVDTDWSKGTGWTISGGKANCDGSQTSKSNLVNSVHLSIPNRYIFKFEITNYSSGNTTMSSGNISIGHKSGVGTYTAQGVLTIGVGNVNLVASDDFVGSIDNIIVQELNPKTLIDFDSTNGVLEDKQVGSVVGDDLVKNGGFDTNSDWTYASCWSISNGKAHFDTSGSSGSINQVIGLESGKKYKLIFTISNNTNGRLGIYSNIGVLIDYTEYSNGKHIVEFTGDGGTSLKLYGHTNYQSFDLDDVQLYEIRDDLAATDVVVTKNGALFNGSTSMIDTGTDMIGTKPVTVMGWIKPYSFGEGSIYDWGRILDNGKLILRVHNDNRLRFYQSGAALSCYPAVNSINLNKYNFISLTLTSDGTVNFYIGDKNTAPALSGSANQDSGTPVAGTTNVIIGNNNGKTRTFDGLINKLKVIEGILDLSEITRYWSSTRKEIQ